MQTQHSSMLDTLGQGVRIAEKQREKRRHEGFLAELCRGKVDWKELFPWPERSGEDLAREEHMTEVLRDFLKRVDPEAIDQQRAVPLALIEEMAEKGFFALKVPEALGGKGLSQTSYTHFVGLAASYSSAIAILISADNTIGVKFPILKYGSAEQKARYLPRLIEWPSGFGFTEDLVGSDPASMETYALRVRDGNGQLAGYRICGKKWYTTNSALEDGQPFAEYLAVVARIVDRPEETWNSECYGIFIVPTNTSKTVCIGVRNEFCGMRGIYNANPEFKNVYVDAGQRIGKEGEGFRIALEALNTGRIAIAAACTAVAKQAFDCSRWYARRRVQWGGPIGNHQAISKKLESAASNIHAMEAMTEYAALLTDQGKDARLAAAACKVFASERAWTIVDDMMQIFGGRGYETYASLSRREKTAPVERMWRDTRPNRIFEGSTQILSQWLMREGWDHMKERAEAYKSGGVSEKFQVATSFVAEYLKLLGPSPVPDLQLPLLLEKHLQFVERCTRKVARKAIVCAGTYQDELKTKQLTLERFFWILTETYAMAASCAYAQSLGETHGRDPAELANMFCLDARLRIKELFRSLDENNDEASDAIGRKIMTGGYAHLRDGIVRIVE